MTTTTNLPAVADGADNVLANAGQAVIHTSETLLGDIVALFSGTTYGHVFLAQIAAIAFAVFVGLVVHKVAGARIKALTIHIGRENWKAKAISLCLNTINDILFSVTAAALLSLCVWGITETGFLSERSELVLVRVAYQIFYAWAILLVLMQFLTLLLGERMFGKSLRHAVRIAFWVLAVLQIIDVLPVIVDWMRACQLPIGTDKLTVWALIVGVLTLFLALGIASRISGLCEAAIMNMREMEMNSRVALARLCRVGFLILGVLIGLSSAGIDLTVLSVFGGALGVGIGFGMQKIASNYISGFIILCDKSIKIGDMVNAAGFTGIITQINTRYSVLRNTSGEEMIVPNENFVTGSVMNYSHTDTSTLVTLDVSCAYESDVDEALRVLSECVLAQPRVLNDPNHKPWFAVTEFAASGINLRAAFWIADPRDGTVVLKSNIFRTVLKAYNEAGIDIPYDKLEVTLKNTAAPETQAADQALSK